MIHFTCTHIGKTNIFSFPKLNSSRIPLIKTFNGPLPNVKPSREYCPKISNQNRHNTWLPSISVVKDHWTAILCLFHHSFPFFSFEHFFRVELSSTSGSEREKVVRKGGFGNSGTGERRKIGHAIAGDPADRRNLKTISRALFSFRGRRGTWKRTGELLRLRLLLWLVGYEEIH